MQIPMTNQPNRTFSVTVKTATGNRNLRFYSYWNEMANYWQLNITDASTNTELIDGLPLICSKPPSSNLLQQYAYLAIGSAYIIPVSSSAGDYPGVSDWGTNFILLWGP